MTCVLADELPVDAKFIEAALGDDCAAWPLPKEEVQLSVPRTTRG
jgi:hypothetical protein